MAPNILYVMPDQWRAQAFGYAGDPNARTPRIDALARESLDLRYAVAGTPVCCPTRASLLTGMRPDRHGLFLNDAPLDPSADTLGKRFAAAGYDTAWIGKWHVDGHGRRALTPRGRRQGFAYWKAQECTHDYHDSLYHDGETDEPRRWQGYDAFAQADDAIALLERRRQDRPLLLVLSWGPPHNPYGTAPGILRTFDPAVMELRANVPEDAAWRERIRRDLAGYYAHGAALDHALGRLLDALERTGMADDTIVVFTSDHGDMLGSHGLMDKQCPWDESIRVPFLLRWPAGLGRGGGRSDVVIDAIDIMPTLCGLAGVAAPPGVQGRDLSGHLRGGTTPDRNDALYAAYQCFGNWRPTGPELTRAREARGVRTVDALYVEDLDGPWLLYDLADDPLQQRNLVDTGAAAALQRTMRARLHERLTEAGDRFPTGEELLARWGYPIGRYGSMPMT